MGMRTQFGASYTQVSSGQGTSIIVPMLSSEPVSGSYWLGTTFRNTETGETWVVSRNAQGQGYLIRGTVPADFLATAPGAPAALTVLGGSYHYDDGQTVKAFLVESLGNGSAGLPTVEGNVAPIGSVLRILDGPGAGQRWRVTGMNTAVFLPPPSPPPPAPDGSGSGGAGGGNGTKQPPPAPAGFPAWGWAAVAVAAVLILGLRGK